MALLLSAIPATVNSITKVIVPCFHTLLKLTNLYQSHQSTGATSLLNTTTLFRIRTAMVICAVRSRHVSKVGGLQSLPTSLLPCSRPTLQEPATGKTHLCLNPFEIRASLKPVFMTEVAAILRLNPFEIRASLKRPARAKAGAAEKS